MINKECIIENLDFFFPDFFPEMVEYDIITEDLYNKLKNKST